MDWDKQVLLWDQAHVSIRDVRIVRLPAGSVPFVYQLPASCFIYIMRGRSYLKLDQSAHWVWPHHLLHGGKGMRLESCTREEELVYEMVIYQANPSPHATRWLAEAYEQFRPFDMQYVYMLPAASQLRQRIADMLGQWQAGPTVNRLGAKASFYAFVSELLHTMAAHRVSGKRPNTVQQIEQYLKGNYRQPIVMAELAEMFNCSLAHLTRLFKREMGTSPIHYLIALRMEHAKMALVSSDLDIREIAERVGYSDVFHFSRMFKKHVGCAPLHYRSGQARIDSTIESADMTSFVTGFTMESFLASAYTDNDNCYQYKKGEKENMSIHSKPSTLVMTMLIVFSLLMSACQPANNQNTSSPTNNQSTVPNTNQTSTPASEQQQAPAAAEQAATRMYKHIDGETEIPVEPKRVFTDLKVGQLIAVGVTPIGSASYPLQTGFIDASEIEDVGVYPLNLEKLASLEPDLIILTEAWRDGSGYESFSKIAPTVVIPNHAADMAEELLMFGDIVNKREEAEQWIAAFDDKVATAKEQVQAVISPEETFTVLNVREDAFMIYDDTNMGGNVLYKYLGLKPQAKVQSDVLDGEVWEISAEAIPEYIGDHLFIASNADAAEALETNRNIWANTKAVVNDKVYGIDFNKFLLSDPISASNHLDIIVELLLEKNGQSQ